MCFQLGTKVRVNFIKTDTVQAPKCFQREKYYCLPQREFYGELYLFDETTADALRWLSCRVNECSKKIVRALTAK